MFFAINTKIPIFIVGKPGYSKSLSFQLINKSMKGVASNNNLFRSLPNLMIFPFQGSLTSTSKGVISVFDRANKSLIFYSKK